MTDRETATTFRVVDGRITFTAAPHQTILEAAQRAGLTIPHACGNQGECTVCRFELIEGELSPPSARERELADDLSGARLSCQARPRSDLRIEFYGPIRDTDGKVQERTWRSDRIL